MNVFWILPLIILFGGGAIIAILGRIAQKETPVWNLVYAIVANISFLITLGIIIFYRGSFPVPVAELSWNIGGPIGSTFKLDELTWWLMLIFTLLGSVVAIYSIRYMDHDTRLDRYYFLLVMLVAGMIGVVMSGDLFTLFIFWETMSIASYVLVAFRKEQPEPIEAGIKYLFMSAFGSVVLLFGMSLLYGLTGTLNFVTIGTAIASKTAGVLTAPYYIVAASSKSLP